MVRGLSAMSFVQCELVSLSFPPRVVHSRSHLCPPSTFLDYYILSIGGTTIENGYAQAIGGVGFTISCVVYPALLKVGGYRLTF